MITISLCMIVKNEQEVLESCLQSVWDLVDEIIIVDTGSTDKTMEIAGKFTENLYFFEWIDDFSAARNYSFSKATMNYIFWIDADDIMLEEDRKKFKRLKESLHPSVDVVMMKYHYAVDTFGYVDLCLYRERLIKRNKELKWQDPIHEFINIDGNIINSDICITHTRIHTHSDRNLKIFEKMIAESKIFTPRNLFYYARELYDHDRFEQAVKYFNQFINSGEGWIEDIIYACYTLSICFNRLKDEKNCLKALFKSFEVDLPRAEICCQLGNYYMEVNIHKAIFWYELALKLEQPRENWGFVVEDCWGFIPNLQLCVCYDKLGDIEKASEYNEIAATIKPNAPAVLSNKRYFESFKKKE